MAGFIKKAVLGTALAASSLAATAPADAQYRGYRGHRGGGDAAAGAIIGGIVGLGLGAAIASGNNRDRYYDRGYYNDGYYRAPPRVVYRQRYYAPPVVVYRDYDRGYNGYYDRRYDDRSYRRGYYGY
jgi:hypothetical protein